MDINIGEKIRSLRQKNNLTQKELADRCELSKGFISQLESNQTSPSLSTLEDVRELAALSLYGAIIGKAYYTGAIALAEAIEVAK